MTMYISLIRRKKTARGLQDRVHMLALSLLVVQTVIIAGCGSSANTDEFESAVASTENDQVKDVQIHLSGDQVREFGITVGTLEAGSATAILSRPGTLTFDLDRIARVGPRISAKVVSVLKDLGDEVAVGGALAVMSSIELGKAKADFLTAGAHLRTAAATLEREEKLYEQKISSEAELISARSIFQEEQAERQSAREALRLYGLSTPEIDEIQTGGEQPLSIFYLKSPAAGVIQERAVSPGQTVGPQETPFHVADVSSFWLMIDAFEQDVPLLATEQEVLLTVRSLPDRVFRGRTNWVSYALDDETRTVHVRAFVANTEGVLRAGMFGTARIQTGSDSNYAMIPVDAVQMINGNHVVFVPGDEENSFVFTEVQLGKESEGYYEILAGLAPGQQAVVTGAFSLMSAQTAGDRSADHGH
ncbi:MAG: hypothetical protein BMS9Abin05_0541 [Rhodothermia bacterium]|nr:MAG: hypothetical protein BMS9Abin05_0541 [Rhodothermia bacterium]